MQVSDTLLFNVPEGEELGPFQSLVSRIACEHWGKGDIGYSTSQTKDKTGVYVMRLE
jgi:hypothetical protein